MNIIDPKLKFKGNFEENKPDTIILHHALHNNCTIYDIHNWHLENGWNGFGYHFFIDKKGNIYKGRGVRQNGSHCKEEGMNTKSIAICLEGCYTDYSNMTDTKVPIEQYNAVVELSKYIMQKYSIRKIFPHSHFAKYKDCPGKYFNFGRYLSDCFSPIKVEQWKLDEVKKAAENGYIDNYEDWAKKVNESIPTWAVFEMLNDICDKFIENNQCKKK